MKYKIAPCTTKSYYLEYKVYYKRGFFSSWKQFGRYDDYLKLEECVAEIIKHKTAMLQLDKLNGKNLKENL